MASTSDVESVFFRHLTGRASPRIPHPTANNFDLDLWKAAVPDEVVQRDFILAKTAVLINGQVRLLRDRYIARVFEGLSPRQVVALSIAVGNRAFLLIREKTLQAIAELKGDSGVAHLSAISQVAIITHDGADPQVGTDVNTAVIDTLPHWFAAAAQLPEPEQELERDFSAAAARGEAMLSLESAFREVWQQVLWEPWAIQTEADLVRVTPINPDEQAMWRVWDWREQAIQHQGALLNRHLERRYPDTPIDRPLARTVQMFAPDGGTITLDAPTADQSALHRSTFDLLEDSYVSIFLDQTLNDSDLTPRHLMRACLVLQDLLAAALPDETDPETVETAWVSRMSCQTPRASIVSALEEALSLSHEFADSVVTFLTSDPHGPLTTLFTQGVWHRPLIATQQGDLLLVAGALIWGSPVRAVERWLQAGPGTDLTATTNGLRFEQDLRERIGVAVGMNRLLAGFVSGVRSVSARHGLEEIDLVFRLGSTIVVGEIKCFLGPGDPIDRYNYLRKLEDAAGQARRKAAWLSEHRDVIADILPPDQPNLILRFLPIVIVNQSNGSGWSFEGCPVTDAHWLEVFLSSGTYSTGAAIAFDGQTDATFTSSTLYRSAAEAEAAMPEVFERHPGIAAFANALDWSENGIPLADGHVLRMAYPVMNQERYVQNFQAPGRSE
jgi:hypothetical protein